MSVNLKILHCTVIQSQEDIDRRFQHNVFLDLKFLGRANFSFGTRHRTVPTKNLFPTSLMLLNLCQATHFDKTQATRLCPQNISFQNKTRLVIVCAKLLIFTQHKSQDCARTASVLRKSQISMIDTEKSAKHLVKHTLSTEQVTHLNGMVASTAKHPAEHT